MSEVVDENTMRTFDTYACFNQRRHPMDSFNYDFLLKNFPIADLQ